MPVRARYDEEFVFAVLDAAPVVHLAVVVDGEARVLPTLAARHGRRIYLHGSPANALLRAAVAAGRASLAATIVDGLRLARSGFESSIAYRSVVAFGPVVELEGSERDRALDRLVERVLPGRLAEVRPMSPEEARRTMVVALDVEEASGKWSAGPTDDDPEDVVREIWSGVVPLRTVAFAPIPSFDGAMVGGLLPSPSVRALRPVASPVAADLLTELARHEPLDAREAASMAALVDRLGWPIDPFSEWADPCHVTASAFLVSARGVVLHRHRRLDRWLQPGGHLDPGEAPLAAAVREAAEETGLTGSPIDPRPFHIDVHPGPRGHTHYDLRYLLAAPPEDPRPGPGESEDVGWYPLAAAIERADPDLAGVLAALTRRLRPDGTLDG